ncbi:MAG: hypothetical protein OXC08_18910 [Thiotrichales bacterium]|nr:hypothetical protein [Thiotrichales bacterium]
MPALTYVTNIFQDNNRIIYAQMTNLLVPLAAASRPGGLGLSVVVDDEAGVALSDIGSTRLQTTPSATRWVVGTDVSVRFLRGDGRYLAADGEFYAVRGDDEPLIKENFYHVSPETGLWVEGLGLAEGGLPAVFLPEDGLSAADLAAHKWRGLLVGLSREDAGGDWLLTQRPGQEAVPAHADVVSGAGTLRIFIDPSQAVGSAGNAYQLQIVNQGTDAVAPNFQAPLAGVIGLRYGPLAATTLAQAAMAFNALDGASAQVVAGDGSQVFPRPGVIGARNSISFEGGIDAADLGLEFRNDDPDRHEIVLEHLRGHTLQEIHEFLNGTELDADTTLYTIIIAGSDPAASLADGLGARPFVQIFSRGSLPRPSSDEIDARVNALVKPYALDGGPLIAGTDADSAFVLEPEVTQAFLLGIIGLTQAELNDLFVDARVQGTGAARSVIIDQKDGSTISLALGDTTGGTGGSGGADGVLSGIEFAGDGSTLTARVAEADGTTTTYTINVPAALRQAGLSQPQVQNLITAYLQDYDTATEVAADIAQSLTNYRRLATVVSNSGDVTLTPGDRGSTLRHTGNAAATYSPATADPPLGWWTRLLNTSTAVLTFDVGVTRRIEGAGQSVEVAAGDCVTVQFLGAATWAVITDTAGAAAAGGGGEAAREQVVLADARLTLAGNPAIPVGQETVAWPADYTDYREYEVVIADNGRTVATLQGRTAWLALQQDADVNLGFLDKDEAGSRQWVVWTPSTRTMSLGGQSATGVQRFVAARLYDPGAGGSGEIPDNSIAAAKALAGTNPEQIAWRDRLDTAKISVGTTLPAIADTGRTEIRIMAQDVADGLSFVDIIDRAAELTAAAVGDVIMTITFRDKQWVRVGNVITGRGDAEARAGIAALMLRVAANEQLTSDIDRIVDSVSWANAPAAEAQFAAVLATSALGRKITRVDQTAIDPAVDIPAATQWNTVLNPVPDDSAILVRVQTGLAPIQFRLNNNGSTEPLFSFRSRVSDANWDYYQGGVVSGGASAIEKRTEAFHTAWHGELAGRALAQVQAAQGTADNALGRTQRLRPINQWIRGGGAQNLLLEWKPVGAVANGAAIAVNVAGTAIAGVTTSEGLAAADTNGTVLSIAVNAANAGTIDRAANTIAGHVEIQITHGGVVDSCWMGVSTPRVERLANEAAYTAITTKHPHTIYWWP